MKKFIAFGCTIAHCEEIRRQFMAAGVHAALYTSETPDDERTELVTEFRKPDSYVRGLISVAALAKGFDVEDVEVVILARPLRKGFSDHIQMIGRGLRKDPANPSKCCCILDHAGNCLRFWNRMNEFFDEGCNELDDGKPKPKKDQSAEGRAAPEPKKCPKCHHVHSPRPTCPNCGYDYPRRSGIHHLDGQLIGIGMAAGSGKIARQQFYSELIQIGLVRGYKQGFPAAVFKERFGTWPHGLAPDPAMPSLETLNWVQHSLIKHAKASRKRPRRSA